MSAGNIEPKATVEKPPEEIKTTVTVEKSGNNPIEQEALTTAWNNFANEMKAEDMRLFSMLTAHKPNLQGETKIVFPISNPLQKEPLLKIQSKLLQHMKSALYNENVEIEIVLSEKNETAKAFTAEEKFVQMSGKNPALMALKQQFTLDYA